MHFQTNKYTSNQTPVFGCFRLILILLLLHSGKLIAQNPLVRNQYTADPSTRVFGDRVYIFPSHDILATAGKGRPGWFCMEDYHVFSSENLTEWTDHGVIVHQNKVPWVRPDSYSMWAPDCIYRNGKYYFYFPAAAKDTINYGRGFTIGVAVADKPWGPYTSQASPIEGVRGIDPNVFIDKDGQAYLYWSAGNIYAAKLKENMLALDSKIDTLGVLPVQGLKEGPYMFERNGNYYLTYPHVENKIERLEYAMSKNPLGPFTVTGILMDESPSGCWTNHQSVIQYKGQWYLFYHDRDYSPHFDKARSIRADSLFFNADGTIVPVKRTLRGIGITDATKEIQIDRYSAISDTGVYVDFIDTINRFTGWKVVLEQPGAWVQYNTVGFNNKNLRTLLIRARGLSDATVQIRLGHIAGPVIATTSIKAEQGWNTYRVALQNKPAGIKHIAVNLVGSGRLAIDWLKFE